MGASTYNLTYDAENRLTGVSGAATATFVYDGDGNRVKGTVGGVTTTYIGNYFEWTGSTGTMKKYYYANGVRVAVRTGASTLNYLFGDHLGSTALTADSNGAKVAELRYKAWGETRHTFGMTPTTYHYTGQREETALGIYFYGARYYDASLGRFLQADTIVPLQSQGTQAWDRFAYVNNNPVKYTDPSGHDVGCSSVNPECRRSNAVEKDGSGLDLETRYDLWRFEHYGVNKVSKSSKIYASFPELKTWDAREWAFSRLVLGPDRENAMSDLLLTELEIVSNGFMAMAIGGDLTSSIGSGNAYSVAYETTLPPGSYPGTPRSFHYSLANKALLQDMKADVNFAKGIEALIPGIQEQISGQRGWSSPIGWTWHHATESGVMQLVPTSQHVSSFLQYLFHPGGSGGFAIWGK